MPHTACVAHRGVLGRTYVGKPDTMTFRLNIADNEFELRLLLKNTSSTFANIPDQANEYLYVINDYTKSKILPDIVNAI